MADNNQLLNNNEDDGVGGGDDVFVYTGEEQEVPRDVKRVRIAENVDTIPMETFRGCLQLIEVEGHDKIKKIKGLAFHTCLRLRRVTKMTGVKEIEDYAFENCEQLRELELNKLEIIGRYAILCCSFVRSINMASIRRVGQGAFQNCDALTEAVFGQGLGRIQQYAFWGSALRRIVIPLKDNLIIEDEAFSKCENLSNVDVVDGGIHETIISSLHLETWRNDMQDEIDRINQTLPFTPATEKTGAIREWITSVLSRMEHYKAEHRTLLKEAMTLLDLALWKAKLLSEVVEEKFSVEEVSKNAKIVTGAARKEHRVTCGASIVIKNVLPYLALK